MKIRQPPVSAPRVSAPDTAPKPQATKATEQPQGPAGFAESSAFEGTARRAERYSEGLGDTAQGRRVKGGVADDSVGRNTRGGVADDSVGRKVRGGVADDSVGTDLVRDALVGPDTDPARNALRAQLYERLENPSYLFDRFTGRPVEPRQLRAGLSELSESAQLNRLVALADANPLVGERVSRLLTATRGLPKDLQRSLVQTLAQDPSGVAGAVVGGIAGSSLFRSLSTEDKTKLGAILSRLDDAGLRLFGSAVERAPGVLLDASHGGARVLDSLAQIATQPLNGKLYAQTSTEELLSGVLRDIVNPNRVRQGDAPTCTVASMQFELVADEPAEYARLIADLSGPTGKATMRGGGDLRLDAEDAAPEARDGRSVGQAMFQSAAMEYANGRDADFDPISRGSYNDKTGAAFRGLKPRQQTTILRQLFGVRYETVTLYDEKAGQKMLENLRGWDSRGHQNRPILVDLDQGPINHAVTLERIKDGRVFFRDPYGAIRSMPEAMFPRYVVAVHQPTDFSVA